jgi:hypothetical protein
MLRDCGDRSEGDGVEDCPEQRGGQDCAGPADAPQRSVEGRLSQFASRERGAGGESQGRRGEGGQRSTGQDRGGYELAAEQVLGPMPRRLIRS